MKRLLLVAYYFPPQPEAAAWRMGQIAEHLPQFGWEVTVITRAFPGEFAAPCEVVTTRPFDSPHPASSAPAHRPRRRWPAAFRYATQAAWSAVNFPDQTIWWLPTALTTTLRTNRTKHFDAIMTSHSPCAGHLLGALVSRLCGLPWVADYQDLWTGNPRAGKSTWRQRVEAQIERVAVRRAAAITSCEVSFGEALGRIHTDRAGNRRSVTVIPHAADPAIWATVPDAPPTEFRLCYAGRLYPAHATTDLLFSVLAKLRRKGSEAGRAARFDYYGFNNDMVLESAARHGIGDAVVAHGLADRARVLRAQRESAVLLSLLATNGDPRLGDFHPSKLFEYVGARRLVLAIGPPNGVVEKFLATSDLGLYASDESSCAQALEECYRRFCDGRYAPALRQGWKPFGPAESAAQFAKVLDDLVEGERSRGRVPNRATDAGQRGSSQATS